MGSVISVKKLGRTYPGKVPTPALKQVSFEIKKGEFLGIMGKSGSGKSTLLRCLGLLDTATSGEFFMMGKNVFEMTDQEKTQFRLQELGYIFQEYAVIFELNAVENVMVPLLVDGKMNYNKCKERGVEVLTDVGLENRIEHFQDELSGGEQQRVAIARALGNSPHILFADEPCANLDSATSNHIMKLLSDLNKKLGLTIIMVSHEEEDIRWMNRVIWLKDGLIDKIQVIKK